MFTTIRDVELQGKKVLLRADYNVPLDGEGRITDDYRIRASIPTVRYLLDHGATVIIVSHLGRPEGEPDPKYSLQPAAHRLSQLLELPVHFSEKTTGELARNAVDSVPAGAVVMLENLRFDPREKENDGSFAQELAGYADLFVQDGFGVVHRAHASTEAITRHLPSVGGLLLEKEFTTITQALENPKRPLVAVVGGAKISDKIQVLERLIEKADQLIVGGAMANTFLRHQGFAIGKSMYEEGQDEVIGGILKKAEEEDVEVWLPVEKVAVAHAVEPDERRVEVGTDKVGDDELILDVVPDERVLDWIKQAGTVLWNGPLGMTELPEFATSSRVVAAAIRDSQAESIIGGGDTAGFVIEWDERHGDSFSHVSTGGGATLDLIAGKELPGISALERK